MIRKLQHKDNISNNNKNFEVWNDLLYGGTPRVFTQRDGHPLPPISILHGSLPRMGIPRNDHDHWEMIQKCVLLEHNNSGMISQ